VRKNSERKVKKEIPLRKIMDRKVTKKDSRINKKNIEIRKTL